MSDLILAVICVTIITESLAGLMFLFKSYDKKANNFSE